MSAPKTGILLAAYVADRWIEHRPTGYDEDDVRAVTEWRELEIGGARPHQPWEELTRGTVGERLRDAARDVRLVVSALRCPSHSREHMEEDLLRRLADLESTLDAIAKLATMEEHAVCFALEHATYDDEREVAADEQTEAAE